MDPVSLAAILLGGVLLASMVSVEFGISVALIELALGVALGNIFSLDPNQSWLVFIAGFASVVLTFLAGAEVETGMMPGASYRVIDDQPLRERATVVGAQGADSEDLSATAYKQNRLLSDMTEELGAVRQFGGGDAERQIGTGGSRLYVSHCVLPGKVASFTNA